MKASPPNYSRRGISSKKGTNPPTVKNTMGQGQTRIQLPPLPEAILKKTHKKLSQEVVPQKLPKYQPLPPLPPRLIQTVPSQEEETTHQADAFIDSHLKKHLDVLKKTEKAEFTTFLEGAQTEWQQLSSKAQKKVQSEFVEKVFGSPQKMNEIYGDLFCEHKFEAIWTFLSWLKPKIDSATLLDLAKASWFDSDIEMHQMNLNAVLPSMLKMFPEERDRLAIAQSLFKNLPERCLNAIETFSFTSPDIQKKMMEFGLSIDVSRAMQLNTVFELTDPHFLVSFAKKAANTNGESFMIHFPNLGFTNTDQKIKLLYDALVEMRSHESEDSVYRRLKSSIKKFGFTSIGTLLQSYPEFAFFVHPSTVLDSFLDPNHLPPEILANLLDEDFLKMLHVDSTLRKHGIPPSVKDGDLTFQIFPPWDEIKLSAAKMFLEVLKEIQIRKSCDMKTAFDALIEVAKQNKAHKHYGFFKNSYFPDRNALIQKYEAIKTAYFERVASRVSIETLTNSKHLKPIQLYLREKAQKQESISSEESRSLGMLIAKSRGITDSKHLENLAECEDLLPAIMSIRSPDARYRLISLLVESLTADPMVFLDYKILEADVSNTSSNLGMANLIGSMLMSLCGVYGNETAPTFFFSRDFKDASKLKHLLDGILPVIAMDISVPLKKKLICDALENSSQFYSSSPKSKREKWDRQLDNLGVLGAMCRSGYFRDDILSNIQKEQPLLKQLGEGILKQFRITDTSISEFFNQMKPFGDLNVFLSYFAKGSQLDRFTREKFEACLRLFYNALKQNKYVDFRYGNTSSLAIPSAWLEDYTTGNQHFFQFPQELKKSWREGWTYDRNIQSHPEWRVEKTDDPYLSFMMGRLSDSCQSPYAPISNSICLPSYFCDPKNQFLIIHKNKKPLTEKCPATEIMDTFIGRAKITLMRYKTSSESKEWKPALFIERPYSRNLSDSDAVKQHLADAALELARHFKIPVFLSQDYADLPLTSTQNTEIQKNQNGVLESKGGPWLSEYVDSGGGVKPPNYTLPCDPMVMITGLS